MWDLDMWDVNRYTDWFFILCALIASVYNLTQRKKVKDERDQLIELKALRFSHFAMLGVLMVMILAREFAPGWMMAKSLIPICAALLLGEVIGKIYYERVL